MKNDSPDLYNSEITPEMLDAGVTELVSYDSEFESYESAVERIYRAMVRAIKEQ